MEDPAWTCTQKNFSQDLYRKDPYIWFYLLIEENRQVDGDAGIQCDIVIVFIIYGARVGPSLIGCFIILLWGLRYRSSEEDTGHVVVVYQFLDKFKTFGEN